MKRILVTGGAGFIGSNFIKMMVAKYPGYSFINMDALTYAGNLENLSDIEKAPNYTFIHADIRNRDAVRQVFENYNIDRVVNFAAESHVDRSIEEPDRFLSTNVMGTQVLLDEARLHWKGMDDVKFLQISTDEVYGTLGATGKFSEVMPLLPNSPYSASKASADMLVRAYHKTYGLPVNITRCSNNYGPFQYPEKLIPLMIQKAISNRPLPVYGDGLQIRDWLYVFDHCTAIDTVLHHGKEGEIYNVGGNNEKNNIDVVKAILGALGKSENLIEHVKDRPGHDRRYAIDSSKIMKELGWKPAYTFEKGLQETIEWYSDKWKI